MVLIKPNKPIVWKDDNTLSDEMPDEIFQEKVAQEQKTRDIKKYGRDGVICVWERRFNYRKLTFLVKVIRYYVLGVPLSEMKGMNKIGKWAVLETTDSPEIKKIAEFIEYEMNKSDWLYKDTLHLRNDKQTLKQMVDEMIEYGKSDIDWWLDKSGKELEENHISALKKYQEVKNVLSKA